VLFDGQDISQVAPHQRGFGLMFQDYALFPHKDVFDNVAFGLRMRQGIEGDSGIEVTSRVHEVLALVGLRGFERRNVSDLSGGEAQRVALARSLAPRPRLLMLDEPLGSLDRATRERLMMELRDILTGVRVTTLYVTHDQTEAFSIADRAVILNAGQVEQVGLPEAIYRRPATEFIARFLGMTNLAQGTVVADGQVETPWGVLETDTSSHRPRDHVHVLIRSEAASLVASDSLPGANSDCVPSDRIAVRGWLVARSFRGGRYKVRIEPETGPHLSFELAVVEPLPAEVGRRVTVALHPAGVVLLPVSGSVAD
jgi:ABC-type Fe3+/spermidine/putrescine transport system ATPase subunit